LIANAHLRSSLASFISFCLRNFHPLQRERRNSGDLPKHCPHLRPPAAMCPALACNSVDPPASISLMGHDGTTPQHTISLRHHGHIRRGIHLGARPTRHHLRHQRPLVPCPQRGVVAPNATAAQILTILLARGDLCVRIYVPDGGGREEHDECKRRQHWVRGVRDLWPGAGQQ
jgi:hypothetical protein